ncbi:MAG: hypothetical protein ACTSYX_02600 [Candidatus Thorarchaeota archaeon]
MPKTPILTKPGVNVTMDANGYIVIRWKTQSLNGGGLIYNETYHVDCDKRISWSSKVI